MLETLEFGENLVKNWKSKYQILELKNSEVLIEKVG
jgi:hypothetical protein